MGTGPDRGAIFRLEYLKGNLFIMGGTLHSPSSAYDILTVSSVFYLRNSTWRVT